MKPVPDGGVGRAAVTSPASGAGTVSAVPSSVAQLEQIYEDNLSCGFRIWISGARGWLTTSER